MQSIQEHLQRPYRRFVDLVRNRVNSINNKMHDPVFLDQYPGHSVPFCFSKIYDLGFVQTRPDASFNGAKTNANTWHSNAPVVDMSQWILPRNGNILVNQEGPFYLDQVNMGGFFNLTPNTQGNPAGPPIFPEGVGDIFDPVSYSDDVLGGATTVVPNQSNGGGLRVNYFYDFFPNVYSNAPGSPPLNDVRPCINFDLILFDKKRSRQLHDDVLSPHLLSGQDFSNKFLGKPMRFDPNTTIEPRVRILKCKPGSIFNDGVVVNTQYDLYNFRGFLTLTFKGYKVLEKK